MVGCATRQDPGNVRNRQLFLRQSGAQKIARIVLTLLIAFTFAVWYYNVSQFDNVNLSRQETIGPLVLFLILWFLTSSWVAFTPKINPPLPPLVTCRLRLIELIFDVFFTHRTDVYKFLRAYAAARQENHLLSLKQYLVVIGLAAFYAMIPDITRAAVGDDSDDIEYKAIREAPWRLDYNLWFQGWLAIPVVIGSRDHTISRVHLPSRSSIDPQCDRGKTIGGLNMAPRSDLDGGEQYILRIIWVKAVDASFQWERG